MKDLIVKSKIYKNVILTLKAPNSYALKQFVGKLPTNCLSASDHFVGLALKGLQEDHQRNKLNKKHSP